MKHTSPSRRGWWLLLLVLLAASTPAAGLLFSYSSRSSSLAVNESNAGKNRPSVEDEGIVCFGQVDLIHGVTALVPLQAGRVAEILVEEGQTVEKGEALIRLEDGPARSRAAEAQAALEEAELRLKQARKLPEQQRNRIDQQQDAVEAMRSRLSAAKRQLARQEKLVADKLADEKDLAIHKDHIHELEALLRSEEKRLDELKQQDFQDDILRAEKEVKIMEARRNQAQYALEECVLKAPQRGTVLRVLVGPGDVLGGSPKQPAVQFAAQGPQIVRAEVEQEFVSRIAVGQLAQIQDETQLGRVWKGKVARIADWVTQRRSILHDPLEFTDIRTVEVLIRLASGQPPLRIGQRVRVRIQPELGD